MDDKKFFRVLGKHARSLRKAKEMTIQDVASKSGLDLRQVGRIERGEFNTKIWTLKRYADGVGVTLPELFDFEIGVAVKKD
jgi:transcriptional regulator with XRE-family HTH domain